MISENSNIEESLRIGLIQTTTDANIAWQNGPSMSIVEADSAWDEIKNGFHIFSDLDERPHFIVGRSRYAAEKKSKIVYNSYTCPISGTFKKGVYHESN
jgi:hypothetical protein